MSVQPVGASPLLHVPQSPMANLNAQRRSIEIELANAQLRGDTRKLDFVAEPANVEYWRKHFGSMGYLVLIEQFGEKYLISLCWD